jgi:hypothetical protein
VFAGLERVLGGTPNSGGERDGGEVNAAGDSRSASAP